jgi:splicing factor 45
MSAPAPAPAWSAAALSLAPRKPKPKPVTARPAYVPPPPQAADIIRAASPKLIDREQHDLLGPDGEKLAKAPAMTLAPAKKSVKRNRKGRKIKVKEKQTQERGNGQSVKALKRKVSGSIYFDRKAHSRQAKRRAETVFHAFDPDEPYDPNRPNDLTEYQAYRKREREERRQRLIESKKRKLAGGRSSDESDSDESSEEDVRRDGKLLCILY